MWVQMTVHSIHDTWETGWPRNPHFYHRAPNLNGGLGVPQKLYGTHYPMKMWIQGPHFHDTRSLVSVLPRHQLPMISTLVRSTSHEINCYPFNETNIVLNLIERMSILKNT